MPAAISLQHCDVRGRNVVRMRCRASREPPLGYFPVLLRPGPQGSSFYGGSVILAKPAHGLVLGPVTRAGRLLWHQSRGVLAPLRIRSQRTRVGREEPTDNQCRVS